MRQAGRYLPEYRAVRAKAGGFLDLCYTPELAAEVTLQPIRRFGFDAAILFSDILVVPHALGQNGELSRAKGRGSMPIKDRGDVGAAARPRSTTERSRRSTRPIRRVQGGACRRTTTLLGFCGAPWTVATYMIAGQGTPDQAPARLFAYRDPDGLRGTDRSCWSRPRSTISSGSSQAGAEPCRFRHLGRRAAAGGVRALVHRADAADRRRGPCAQVPGAKIIGFPRGAGSQAAALCRAGPSRRGRARLDGRSGRSRAIRSSGACRCRAISIRWCCSPAARRSTARSTRARSLRRRAVHLQSRPRHPAGDADRPCRADAGTRARRTELIGVGNCEPCTAAIALRSPALAGRS